MAEEGTAELGTAYEGAKDDINDKLVLDLAWERQQKKVSDNNYDSVHSQAMLAMSMQLNCKL